MLIILDRDGVINEDSAEFIKSPDEWIAIPGSLAAIAQLNQAGHTIVIATNQSGIARGYFSLATLNEIHQKMLQQLAAVGGHIEGIFFCPHGPDDGCDCRKPKPGLFYQIASQFNADLSKALAIGDAWRDFKAAQIAGCSPVLVTSGKGQTELAKHAELNAIPVFENLATAVNQIIAQSR